MKLHKRVTKTANSQGNESRIAKQDSKKFPQIFETANSKPANGECCLYIYIYKRASLACAARMADTLCPPEGTLVKYKGDSISKHVCPTVIIDITRKITKFVNFKFF